MNKTATQTPTEPGPYHIRVGRYMGIFEKTGTGYSAYVARLPGLGVTGLSLEETIEHLRTGIEVHLAGIEQDKRERPWLYAKQA